MNTSAAVVVLLAAATAQAQTVSAIARGDIDPGRVRPTMNLLNGDFLILANPAAPVTGDGVDETTIWTFDLTRDRDYELFASGRLPKIERATLTLELTQFFAVGPVTDIVGPARLPRIVLPHFLTAGQTGMITLDLLSVMPWRDLAREIRFEAGC